MSGRRTGTADLPLHGGRVPRWLAERMARLGAALVEILVAEHGTEELLRRLADPFWFQSFGCLLGMDWHSSGMTTSVCGALKVGLADRADALGLWICGGKGARSRRTPEELAIIGGRTGLPADRLADHSRLAAKVDDAAVQDGYRLYQHTFVVDAAGRWVVIQQGMAAERGWARRYHWLSEGLRSFVEEPHAAVVGRPEPAVLDLTARANRALRRAVVELATTAPGEVMRAVHLALPARHQVTVADIDPRRLHTILLATYRHPPADFADLLARRGIGPKGLRAIVLATELIHGTPIRFRDPARFSFAHGGKDGHPYPVDRRTYDRTITLLEQAARRARLTPSDRRVVDRGLRRLERIATVPPPRSYAEDPALGHRPTPPTETDPAQPSLPFADPS